MTAKTTIHVRKVGTRTVTGRNQRLWAADRGVECMQVREAFYSPLGPVQKMRGRAAGCPNESPDESVAHHEGEGD